MGDSTYLERMGMELKCPICLSLLNSAVSLTCNHVFCNSCILASMKSASSCPVCKVPYHRREVRAAPHMDNLVNIYKNMELALGINIFGTQNAPSGKRGCNSEERPGKSRDEIEGKQEHILRKGPREMETANTRLFDSQQSPKPSFPNKKRVRVPQHSLYETPTKAEKPLSSKNIYANSEVEIKNKDNDSTFPKEKLAYDDKGGPLFTPFFWLRERDTDEDDSEYLSAQNVEGNSSMGNLLHEAPRFSDIKDSDDGITIKTTPNDEASSEPKVADVFDSEMFEWTQRACSPELCLTPMHRQEKCEAVEGVDNASGVDPTASKRLKSQNEEQRNYMNKESNLLLSKRKKNSNAKSARKKTAKKCTKTNTESRVECLESLTVRPAAISDRTVKEIAKNPTDAAEIWPQENNYHVANTNDSHAPRKHGEIYKSTRYDKVLVNRNGNSMYEKCPEDPTKSCSVKYPKKGKENLGMIELPKSDECLVSRLETRKRHSVSEILNAKESSKKIAEIHSSCMEIIGGEGDRNSIESLPVLACTEATKNVSQEPKKKTGDGGKKVHSKYKTKKRESRKTKRMRICSDEAATHDDNDGAYDRDRSTSNGDFVSKQLGCFAQEVDNNLPNSKILLTAKDHTMKKCTSVPSKIICAFCKTFEESEASGLMQHYFEGRPVAADHNSGFRVIHSHSYCTEWAPNVYFEDDIVINLEAEVARSKSIRCSCCGFKGASLGCYEKSCRKSFHVPCAKLVPQCRWDTDNFVMLCPLHSSSKLPKEMPGIKLKKGKRTTAKMDLQAHAASQSPLQRVGNWKCPSALHRKWVICCSGLTKAEKEIVSNFAKMVGALESKTWISTVTHVIASTDESGACKRTLKYLMGILEGKWIVKIDWIKACMEAMEPVSEVQFEINEDIHGVKNGPQFGRLRVMRKEPKIFNGLAFYFAGDFPSTFKGDLQSLVTAGGGNVLQRKPISTDLDRLTNEKIPQTFIIYSLNLPENCDSSKKDQILNSRIAEARALANVTGANIAAHSWIMDSIASCELQKLI